MFAHYKVLQIPLFFFDSEDTKVSSPALVFPEPCFIGSYSYEKKDCVVQKQPPRGVLKKRYSENMQQIYRRTPMLCNFATLLKLHFGMGVLL